MKEQEKSSREVHQKIKSKIDYIENYSLYLSAFISQTRNLLAMDIGIYEREYHETQLMEAEKEMIDVTKIMQETQRDMKLVFINKKRL